MDFQFNLQLFSGEKTEPATPKKRQESRKKGQVAKSQEIPAAMIMLMAFFTLRFLGPYIFYQLSSFMVMCFSTLENHALNIVTLRQIVFALIQVWMKAVLPFMLIVMAIGVAANIAQIGFLFTLEPIQPKFSKINPLNGFKRIFSKRALVDLAKALFKVSIISYVVYSTLKLHINELIFLIQMSPMQIVILLGSLACNLGLRISFVLLVLALADFAYQKWEYEQGLKMSKQEIKDEYKMVEGNPQIKGKIKEKQRQMAMSRMMKEVPNADVVITNPTHFAVALKYDINKSNAPYVLAKGADHVALKIKQIAKENKIMTVENRPLAQALFHQVDINQEIPVEFYQAVAEILAFVFKAKKKI